MDIYVLISLCVWITRVVTDVRGKRLVNRPIRNICVEKDVEMLFNTYFPCRLLGFLQTGNLPTSPREVVVATWRQCQQCYINICFFFVCLWTDRSCKDKQMTMRACLIFITWFCLWPGRWAWTLCGSWTETCLKPTLRDEPTPSLAPWSLASTPGTLTGETAKRPQVVKSTV